MRAFILLALLGLVGLAQEVTGLEGYISRGPVAGACKAGVSCDAPFSGGFLVMQEGKVVAHFKSDLKGHYRVLLAPGRYTVVADEKSRRLLWKPKSSQVEVLSKGITRFDLSFDTGIR